jgi:alpha-L-fucosidase
MRHLFALCLNLSALVLAAQSYQPDWNSLDKRPTPEWWQDGKFGIFIHWGPYSVPAFTAKGQYAEWYQHALANNSYEGLVQDFHQKNYGNRSYYDLADDFKAALFNPAEWAQLFEKAGAKYAVLTAKHHDGFCLWPSAEASKSRGFPWSADLRGPNRDLVGEFCTALGRSGVKPGLYFSLYEWYNPLWEFDPARYARDHAMPQLYDLVQRYQPWVLWADGDWDASAETWQSQQFLGWLYNESPVRDRVVVNDRWGSGTRFKHGGVFTPEYQPDMDFEAHDWEESRGIGRSYGYNRAENAEDYSSAQALVLHLVDRVSRGGNFLLNVGPDAYGQIPPIMQERLLEVGKWLEINGEAIYNTRRWRSAHQWGEGRRDWQPGPKSSGDVMLKQTVDPDPGFAVKEVFYTWNPKSKSVYAIFPKYPADRRLVLRGIQLGSGSELTLLATKEKLRTETLNGNTTVFLPDYNPARIRSAHAFALKISNFGAFVDKPLIRVEHDPYNLRPTVTMDCTTPGVAIRYTTDGSDVRDNSLLYERPFSPAKGCQVQARAFKQGLIASKAAEAEVETYTMLPALQFAQAPAPGLRMQLLRSDDGKYDSESLRFASVLEQADVSDFRLAPRCQSGQCGMVWKGYFNANYTGGYQFWLESDDGSVLYLDKNLIVDNDGDHGLEEKSGYAYLQQGWHALQLVYFNSSGPGALKVWYAPLGGQKQEIPANVLAH